jgi:hypothetical protein
MCNGYISSRASLKVNKCLGIRCGVGSTYMYTLCNLRHRWYVQPMLQQREIDEMFKQLRWENLGFLANRNRAFILWNLSSKRFVVWIGKYWDWTKFCCSLWRKEAMTALMSYMYMILSLNYRRRERYLTHLHDVFPGRSKDWHWKGGIILGHLELSTLYYF